MSGQGLARSKILGIGMAAIATSVAWRPENAERNTETLGQPRLDPGEVSYTKGSAQETLHFLSLRRLRIYKEIINQVNNPL